MPKIDRANWQTLEPLLDEAMDLPPEKRSQWLKELSARSPDLAAELTAFLAEEAVADRRGFLSGMPDVTLEGLELGAYRLERILGQGGMGTVWLARRTDGRFEGVAALKLLNLALVSPIVQERFRREGSVLARLTHPGIARLLDAGVSVSGQPFLVLEHVDGKPIDEFARDQELGIADRIRLFLQVLDAVGHAHANLIVHRDLKPSNILVTGDGTVKLLDFGIAKLLDEENSDRTALTLEGGRVFTPLYAAPEQVRGESLTTATDVYALGVLLYFLLSGHHPTGEKSRTPAETVQALLELEPRRLDLGDLDTILAKSLRKKPDERYQTVAAFADDLNRYLRQEPVSARPHSNTYRLGKFVRRHRAGVLTGVLTAAGLIGATVFSLGQMREARHQRDFAMEQTRFAAAQVDFQDALLSQVGEEPITMHQALDSGRAVLERRFGRDPDALLPLLLQLAGKYGDLEDVEVQGVLLARAESLALSGHDPERLPFILCSMADNLRMQGRYEEAWQKLDKAASLPGASDPRTHATCLSMRSGLGSEVDSAEQSVVWAREAIAIMDSLGETGDMAYLSVLGNLALGLAAGDQLRESIPVYRRSIALMDSTGRGGTIGRAMALHNLSTALEDLGETMTAERLLHEVLLQAAAADHTGWIQWQPLIHYAEVALYQGHADSALKYFSITVRQAIRDTNLYWEGRGLFGLARAQVMLGRTAEAQRAKTRLVQIIRKYPHVQDTDDVLPDGTTLDGWIALARGDTAAAKAHFTAALSNNGYFEGKRQGRLRPVALLLAESDVALGQPQEARDLVARAMKSLIVDSTTVSQSAAWGEVRLIEGRALLALGDSAGGRTAIHEAAAALRFGAGPEHPRTRQAERLSAILH